MNGESFAFGRFLTMQKMHRGRIPLCEICLSNWRRMNPR